MVIDDSLDIEYCNTLVNKIVDQNGMIDGLVGSAPKDATNYKASEGTREDQPEFMAYLFSTGLIPILPDVDIETHVRYHEMPTGGKMAWHCDGGYSVAVSIYLSECDGGELEVKLSDGNTLLIPPQENRMVVLVCGNEHRVREVTDGIRKSIQVFITYRHD